ncbi:MAG: TetR/AcrR family transcriptional regulator [Smithella sp.]|jgi:AcrR family transcriptional regulator
MSSNVEREVIRRGQIIDAALREISAKGMNTITVESIAKAAGLSKGGVTYYFKSKDDIYAAVFKEFFNMIFQRSKNNMDLCSDPLSKLLSFGWLYNWEDPDVQIGYPLLFDFMSEACHKESYRTLFHEWVNNWVELLKNAIIEGNNTGTFNCSAPDATAKAISAVYHGIAVRWYLDRDSHSIQWTITSFTDAINGLLSGSRNKI